MVYLKFKNHLMNFEYNYQVKVDDFDEEEAMGYIDFILKSNAANVRAEELFY